jgi:anti-sigma B factor antagonist
MPCPGTVRVTDSALEFVLAEPHLSDHKLQSIEGHLDDLAARAGRHTLRLDFNHVQYLTSTTLGKVVSLHQRMKAAGGSLQVVNLCPDLYDLFCLTRLDTFLDLRRM